MGLISSIFGAGIKEPVEAVGSVIDNLFTSDEERLDKKILLERLAQQPALAQVEVNKLESKHESLFVAGWRPFIGWTGGISIFFISIINPCIQWITGRPGPNIPIDAIIGLVLGILGIYGTQRTAEKFKRANVSQQNQQMSYRKTE